MGRMQQATRSTSLLACVVSVEGTAHVRLPAVFCSGEYNPKLAAVGGYLHICQKKAMSANTAKSPMIP